MAIKHNNITAHFWQEKRESKMRSDGTFPVKLMVYSEREGKNKAYRTPYSFTEKDFEAICIKKPRGEKHKKLRDTMEKYRIMVLEIAQGIKPFTFAIFEKRIGQESRKLTTSGVSDYLMKELTRHFKPNELKIATASVVIKSFDDYIDQLRANNQASTANNYLTALKSFLRYFLNQYGVGMVFNFDHVTPDFLHSYQSYMKASGYSLTSVSMYSRSLRTIYRKGIKQGQAEGSLYPFGRDGYTPPNVRRTNTPLKPGEMQKLLDVNPKCPHQSYARDFLLLSYWCNGANMADILRWKWRDMNSDTITFKRKKTEITSECNQKEIIVYLDESIRSIIDRRCNHLKGKDDYIFPVLNRLNDPKLSDKPLGDRERILRKAHTRKVNTFIKKLVKQLGIELNVTTYVARYSFANDCRNNGLPIEIRMQAMGQSSEKVHRAYLDTIPDDSMREALSMALVKPKIKNGEKEQ